MAIVCFGLNGELLKVFPYKEAAIAETHVKLRDLNFALHMVGYRAGNYYWFWEPDLKDRYNNCFTVKIHRREHKYKDDPPDFWAFNDWRSWKQIKKAIDERLYD